jgi:hypothetical protein
MKMAAALKLQTDSLRAGTPSRVRSQNSPAHAAALDYDRRSGSEGHYAVADETASLINYWLQNTKFLTPPEKLASACGFAPLFLRTSSHDDALALR